MEEQNDNQNLEQNAANNAQNNPQQGSSKGSTFAKNAGNVAKNIGGHALNMVPGLGNVRRGINIAKKIGGAAKKAGGAASKVPKALSNLKNGKPFNKNLNKSANGKSSKQNDNAGNNASANATNNNSGATGGSASKGFLGAGGIKSQLANKALGLLGGGKAGQVAGSLLQLYAKKKLLLVVVGIIFAAISILLFVCVLATPILMLGNELDREIGVVVKFDDKLANLITFNGFKSSSQVVTDRISSAKKDFENYNEDCIPREDGESDAEYEQRKNGFGCGDSKFDEGILFATLQENNTVDPKIFDVEDENSEADEKGDQYYEGKSPDEPFIGFGHIKSYFHAANNRVFLGVPNTNSPAGQGLLYHLIDYKVKNYCVDKNFSSIDDFLASFKKTYDIFAQKMGISLDDVKVMMNALRDWQSMAGEGHDFWEYVKSNAKYQSLLNKASLQRLFENMEITRCKENEFPIINMTQFINYDNYVKYLKEVYVPELYFKCAKCKENFYTEEGKNRVIKRVIMDIIDNRNDYYLQRNEKNVVSLTFTKDGQMVVNSRINYSGTYPVGTEGTGWKQYDEPWGSISLTADGSSDGSMAKIGCLVTSISILMANSHTEIVGDMFDPGILAKNIKSNNGFTAGGGLYVTNSSWHNLAPNFDKVKDISTGSMSFDSIKSTIIDYMNQGMLVVANVNNGGHFIPIVGVENGKIIVSDPGIDEKTGDFDKYKGGVTCLIIFHK